MRGKDGIRKGKQMQRRRGNNPWVTKAMYGPAAHAFDEAGVYFHEYESADERPTEECGQCKATTYFKPTVGAYVCHNCGAVRCTDWVNKVTGERRGGMNQELNATGEWTVGVQWLTPRSR